MPPQTPRRPDKPILWIVAGPNGSGKSSLYNRTDIEGWGGSVWIINPDLPTAKIAETEGLELEPANLAAVQRVEQWLDASIDALPNHRRRNRIVVVEIPPAGRAREEPWFRDTDDLRGARLS